MRRARTGDGPPFDLDVELDCPPGVTILFGPSGSGKTTVLQCVAGLLAPDRGAVSLGGEIWFDADRRIDVPPERRGVAYLFQSLALFPHMTAVGNVMYGIDRFAGRKQRAVRAHELLQRLGVAHLASRRPRTFSGGEAQRVALARALAREPRLFLLDEPFSALHRELRVQLATEVRALVHSLGIPAIQVTHDHAEARAMGDRVIRIETGRVVDQGKVSDLLGADPTEPGVAPVSGSLGDPKPD
jgi:molybdate transport system ATP-binding protein